MARPTLVSLANELGVSRQTVSNVINAPHLVKAETRQRVQEAIDRSGYRPNVAAQALRSRRSHTLAVRVDRPTDDINGAPMERFVHALVARARTHGHSILLVAAADDRDEELQLLELHERGSIDGAVLSGTHLDDARPARLAAAGLPVVCFGRPWGDASATHAWVDVDGAAGARLATEHLLSRGATRAGYLGWGDQEGWGQDRGRGWREAMAGSGLGEGPIRLVDGGALEAVTATERLLDEGADAVVCASDALALGAVEAMRQAGRIVDDFVPVVGFDDSPVAKALGISSLWQPVEACAEALVDALLFELGRPGGSQLPNERLFTPRLMARQWGRISS